jgi:hypothetical protein
MMVAKLNSKTQFQIPFSFFEPFRCVLLQCLQKNSKMQYGYKKTQNLMLISYLAKKLQKITYEKSYKHERDGTSEILFQRI